MLEIPFFSNTPDGTHCFQAALKMALAILMPEREFTYDELDRISQKQPGKWTWPTAAMLWMIDEGLRIKLIEEFDYRDFVGRGGAYLIERFGEEVGRSQIANSDVEKELKIARRFMAVAPLEYRLPSFHDLRGEIANGAVVIVNLNAALLRGLEGYSGHFIVVCDVGDKAVMLHDPGLPPAPNLKVAREKFEKAWAYPTEREKNLLSIYPPRK